MNMDSRIYNDLVNFVSFLNERKITYRIVGSIALEVCGLPIGREPGDIDVEVIADDKVEDIFRALEQLNKIADGNHANNDYPKGEYPYIFKFNKTKVNVFCCKDKLSYENEVIYDGMKFGVVSDILEKKMAYSRPKDYRDFITIIENLSQFVTSNNKKIKK
jgi:hypothetical protein